MTTAVVLGAPLPAIATVFVIVAAVAALADWLAVAELSQGLGRLELIAKPAVPLALLGAVATSGLLSTPTRVVLLGALLFSCAGDVALMLPDRAGKLFLVGLGSFLVAQILYAIDLIVLPHGSLVVGLVVVIALSIWPTSIIVRTVARTSADLLGPVITYILAITVMATAAVAMGITPGSRNLTVLIGGLAFMTSDTLLAINRFVRPLPREALLVHSTYHLALFGLTLGILATA
jgi:uncharacterized membrane protein YhhN